MEQFHGGKVVSFRLPQETPLSVLHFLTILKEEKQRKFSKEVANRFVAAIKEEAEGNTFKTLDYNSVNIPIPKDLSPDEMKYLQNPRTQAMLGQLIVQVLKEPTSEIKITSPEKETTLSRSAEPKTTPNETTEEPLEQSNQANKEFIEDEKLQSFAQNTFLNFDDDDDDD